MQTILIHSLTGGSNQMFDPNERDAYNDPAIYLREELLKLGYHLTTADDNSLQDCARVLFYDVASVIAPYSGVRGLARRLKHQLQGKRPVRNLYAECVKSGLQKQTALFLWEAPAVSQANWDRRLHEQFPVILTWNDAVVDGRKYHKIYWPQTRQFPSIPEISFDQKRLLVNISMNKSSRHSRELYSARRAAIRHFERARPNDFDLYGVGWDRPLGLAERAFPSTRPTYPCYRGTVRHKWDVLPRYRFSLCYENIRDEPGWVTEKIFDSMRTGCVPIYWGAPNITDYVDGEAFIDRRKFESERELEAYLIRVSEKEYARFQDAMKSYLGSERFARFLPPTFADTIIRVLGL